MPFANQSQSRKKKHIELSHPLSMLGLYASCLLAPAIASAELTGFVALDARGFFQDPSYSGQRHNSGPSLVAEPEWYQVSDDGDDTYTFSPFLRLDPYDAHRTHGDIRQLDWIHAGDGWEFRGGFGHVFWGVTESNHLVDVINQTDVIEDTDGEDKFGQPMIQLAKMSDVGTFRFFWLPAFRERIHASRTGRPRPALRIDDDLAQYESGAEEWHQDAALRYEHTLGDFDIGLAYFRGTSREPRFVPTVKGTEAVLAPYYDIINQVSLDLQYTTDSTLWKFEALTKDGYPGERIHAFVGGFEYSFYSVMGSDIDIGLLAEYHYDDRNITTQPFTLFDDDIFLGSRWVMNDVDDTEFLGGVIVDKDTGGQLYSAEFSTRLTNHWKIEADLRLYNGLSSKDFASAFSADDHVQIRLARYF